MRDNASPDSSDPRAAIPAQIKAEVALEDALAEIDTPQEAERVLEKLEQAAENLQDGDFEEKSRSPDQRAAAIAEVAETTRPAARPAAVIAETATQVAETPPEQAGMLDRAISGATGVPTDGGPHVPPGPDTREGRRLLRRALYHRLKPLDAADAGVFIQINNMPHPRWLDFVMRWFSFVMTSGMGWLVPVGVAIFRNPRRGVRIAVDVLPPLWIATSIVEYPVKTFFRRKRPFIAIVRAIVVGRKPGSYSFPSGHTASAFAGATLLARHFPNHRRTLYAVASLVGFSRIYLGAHYPGDVASGGIAGATLAKALRRILCLLVPILIRKGRRMR